MLRWVWLGRVTLACAILVAAMFAWKKAAPSDTLIATVTFAAATLVTVLSAIYAEIERRPLGKVFYGTQCAADLLLVTAVVHITGGWSSQFAALYILVIASAALLLPFRGGLAVAAASCLLYVAEVLWLRAGTPYLGATVQVAVFVVVALGSGYVALRLRQAGAGREELAAQLVKVQLEAADILRTIRSGIMTVDVHGRLLYANPAASELLGLDLRAYTGQPVLPALLPVSPHLVGLLERSARDRVRTSRAEGFIRRGEEEVEIGVTTTVAEGTRPDGLVTATAIFQDISDTKRIQSLHVRAERLQAVAELSASLAHEIRNPLASIRSAAEQLARRRVPEGGREDDDDDRILHDLVVREADRLSRLLADFLDFARTGVSQLALLDVGAIAYGAAMLAASHPDRAPGAIVQVDIAPELPRLDGDEDLLHRAVFNLVLNAVQAVGDEGHVFVEVDRRPADARSGSSTAITGELLAITVTDDGPGIPDALRERLFEPFVSSKAGGTGLGLPVVHRAVEAHRGVVLVDALPRGTRFTVLLPMSLPSTHSSFAGVAA
ncbi:MAG: two-component system sensor histidine kinase NtrB [Gemmatimonas sp.]|jgi:two-component system sensor histidine kinase PilS (NtrC family)|uniref:two-component system sensor histidine kinase NtrB n=1 Tax=Gemmatimonas sp. TaxID=1962908 RepID=UPI00391EE7A8|nr:ATP-binding protein [Gemmatimonadota bacterium]